MLKKDPPSLPLAESEGLVRICSVAGFYFLRRTLISASYSSWEGPVGSAGASSFGF